MVAHGPPAREVVYVAANRLKYEELYRVFSPRPVEPSEEGREQFYRWESFGEVPTSPDPYFLSLQEGKKWFSVQQAEVRKLYGGWEWWGWYQFWVDWEGRRGLLRHLFSWHPSPPGWLFGDEGPPEEG